MGTSIDKIQGLSDVDRKTLRSENINCAEQFWAKISDNPRLIDTLSLPDLAAKQRVAIAFAGLAKKQSESDTKPSLVIHLPDLLIVVVLSLLAVALTFVDRAPPQVVRAPAQVVTARDGLAPFHIIAQSDVEVRNAADEVRARSALNEVTGRYATEQIVKGAVIDPSKLSTGARLSNELDGLRIFNVKLQPTSILANINPPIKLGVILSPRAKDDANKVWVHEVYLLDFHILPDGVSAVVAATDNETQQLSTSLSLGQLIAVGPVH